MASMLQQKLDEDRKRFEQSQQQQEAVQTFALPVEEEFSSFDIMPSEFNTDTAINALEQELMAEAQQRDIDNMNDETTPEVSTALQYAMPVVASWEQFRSKPYYATEKEKEKGILTVGYGQTEGVTEDTVVTEEEAATYLQNQLTKTEERLKEEVGDSWETLTPAQQGSIISLAYNTDKDVVGQLKRSKALKALKGGDLDKFLTEAFDKEQGFVRQGGDVLEGLQRRRAAEENLFLYGDAEDFTIDSVLNA